MKKFKQLILSSQWQNAIDYSVNLPFQDEKSKNRCKFLIYRHWYFDSLLKNQNDVALILLRNQLKVLATQMEATVLSSLVIYTDQKELLHCINQIIYTAEETSTGNTNMNTITSNTQDKKKQEEQLLFSDSSASSSSKDRKVSTKATSGISVGQRENSISTQKAVVDKQIPQTSQNKQTFQDSFTYLIHSIWDLIKERKSIPPVNRLNSIVKQAKSYQILKCPVHTTLPSDYSIIDNHYCRTRGYPNVLASQHKVHEDEVWHVQFSPNGLYAASICKKSTIAIWRVVKKKTLPKSAATTGSAVGATNSASAQIKKKSKKIASKGCSQTTPTQSNHQLLQQQTDNSPQAKDNSLELQNSCSSDKIQDQLLKKKSPTQSSATGSGKVSSKQCQGKEKKLSKKTTKLGSRRINSKVELELVVKKDIDDSSTVQCFSWNQKGNMIVTSQQNKHIIVWKINFEGSKPSIDKVNSLIDSQVEPKSIIFLPDRPDKNDKSIIIYTSDDEYIYMWDYTTENVPKIQCEFDNQSIHLHPNNQDLISVCNQGRISLINLSKKQELGFFNEKSQIINANLSSNGSHILLSVLGKENSLHMWSIEAFELESIFTGYKQTDCLLRASMKDNYVAIGDEEGKIYIWHKNLPQKPICLIHTENNSTNVKIEQFPISENGFEEITDIFSTNQQNSTKMEVENQKTSVSNDMIDESKKTINQVHFNPVYPGMLIAAGDDHTVRLFVSDELNYKLPERQTEKKKFSAIESFKQKVQSLIPCLENKTSAKRSSKNKNKNQIMEEEEGDEEIEGIGKRGRKRSDYKFQENEHELHREDEGDLDEEEDDENEEDDDQQECDEEEDEEDQDVEEQKYDNEEGDTSSNILTGGETSRQQTNPDS